jgi:gliding motility-associated-like protein
MRKILLGVALIASVFSYGQTGGQPINSTINYGTVGASKPVNPDSLVRIGTKLGYPIKAGATSPKVNTNNLSVQQQFALSAKGIKLPGNDPRNLPLSANGKLLSVDGFEVDFQVPSDPNISNICFTPRPVVNGQNKDASCPFTVPCDDPSNRDAVNTTTIKYFQVVWHVMTDGGPTTNIDQTRIDALMAELNADYGSHNMIFCADPATFTEDAVNYTHDESTEEFSLKATYNVTPSQVINVYVVGTMGPGGYARFPYDPNGGTSANGGIVLNRGNCSVGTHTLAHEMGHVFGLEHTFSGVDERASCSSCYEKVRNVNGSSNTTGAGTPLGGPYTNEGDREGDWCSDTNPHDTYSYNCSTSGNANGGCDSNPWANAPVNNHMSYSFCSSQFSVQQGRRMHCLTSTYLGSWIGYGGGICGSQPPAADFVGSPTVWQAPSNVNFTDLSTPSSLVTGWTWIFDTGASGSVTCVGCTGADATFIGQNPPLVTYPNAGLYTVSLTITSANGPDTETKVDYITVNSPAGDCDTLTFQWENPTPSVTTYGFGAGWLAGVPDPANMVLPTDAKGVYEGYFSPNPGTTPVGAIRVGLGTLADVNDDMTFQVVVYDDDGFGAPGAIVGGVGGISPTQLGVPGTGFYNEFWIPLQTPAIPTTAFFHVGVEIFAGSSADTLIVMTSCLGPTACAAAEGENDGSNTIFTSGFGYENLLTVYGADLDVDVIPMLGEYKPLPYVEYYDETVSCDTSYVTIYDSVLYSTPSGWTFTSAKLGMLYNGATDPQFLDLVYTTAGPDTITITAVNDCGRADTTVWVIPYNFMATPNAEFVKDLGNPICTGTVVSFTASTTGYDNYLWDFGDGPPVSSGTSGTITHTYLTPGLYYSSLTATENGFVPTDTLYLENFESGFPAGYARFNNDAFTPNVGVNPPFTGTNATAWLDLDVDGNGNFEATSTSWNGPGEQGDDWMMTSAIGPLPANQMLFWDGEAQSTAFPDGYEVRISTTQLPANITNYSTVLFSTSGENGFPTTRNVNLAAYAGQTVYIAFRNNSTDQFILTIDNIRVGTAGPGCSANITKTDFVEIIDCSITPPVADGNADVTSGCGPLNVTFTDATSTTPDPATSWLWNFDDGNFSTSQNPPVHTYTAAGTYNVIFEACNAGGCTNETITITINGVAEDGSFNLSAASACQNGIDITATIIGNTGGVFTSTAGLSINGSTGAIDVSASTPGSYTVTYTTSTGLCADVETQPVTINANQDATFSYISASFCANGTDPTPTITGTLGGAFSSTGGLTINVTTGLIDVSTSTPGSYTVTYTTAGPCAVSSGQSVTITAADNSNFTLSSGIACQNDADVTATITGLSGGSFSSTAGLSINTSTGTVDVSASTPSTYTVTYATAGACPSSSTQSITITANENASFTMSASSACQSGTDLSATITGDTGGTFTSTAGLSINGTTGAVDVSASTPGSYSITYTTAGTCFSTASQSVTIIANEDASFTLSASSSCQSGSDIIATITGTTGGAFSSSTGLSINGSSGTIDVSASTAGAYTVTYTTSGTCSATSTQSVTINADEDASFSYSSGTYCVSGADPTASITGTTGGTFTATGGLTINPTSGLIDLDATGIGNYVVTYTTAGACPASTTFNIGITTSPDATFSYTGTPYCTNGGTATPTFGPGGSGGLFTALPSGLTINSGTGIVTLASSTPGSYTVTNTIIASGGCAASIATTSIVVNAADDATFNLSAASACQGGTDVTATITGTTGGTFSSSAGLSINGVTGVIDVSASTPGAYTVTYTTTGTCFETSTQPLTILIDEDASYTLSASSACQSGTDITATVTGTGGGTFSSAAGLSINASNGTIDVSTSTAGVYTVTYTTSGTCSVSSNTSVTINADDDASFSYSSASYCLSGVDPTPTISGTVGGSFTSTAGLIINTTTGEIDLSASTIGTYNITYATTGICPASQISAVTITSIDDASFSYASANYCASDVDPTATITGASGGIFSSTTGLTINSTSGLIDLSASTPGAYNVTYTTSGTCSNSATQSITITADDDASFSYSSTSYCLAAPDPSPTISGTIGGSFASSVGLVINGTTGDIDVSASTIGTYIVTYTTSGICPVSSNVAVTITANDDPTFNYSATNYCSGDPDPVAVISGTTGGTFSSTVGLVINSTSGEIDLDASTLGTYSITYTTSGVCSSNSSVSVTIDAMDDATFTYVSATYCPTDTDPIPTITGLAGGTFSAGAGLVINSTTGEIDLDASTPFAYTVTYTTSGICSNTETFGVTITNSDDATFSYSSLSFCSTDTDPLATISGTTGGTFSSTAGIIINTTNGLIDVSASSPGSYVINYTTNGTCTANSNVSIDIITSPAVDDIADLSACGSYTLLPIAGTNLTGNELYYDASGGTGNSFTAGSIITSTVSLFIYDAAGACSSEETFDIIIDTAPSAAIAGVDQIVCDTVIPITLVGNVPTSGTGMWTILNGAGTFSDDTDPTTSVLDLSIGANEYLWTISNGSCPGISDTVMIISEECVGGVVIPSGFTPDGGDNINATWEIQGISSYPECEVLIFNKWGSEIFNSKGYLEAWDGSYNDNPLPVGSYFYLIKLNDSSEPLKGTVTIIK